MDQATVIARARSLVTVRRALGARRRDPDDRIVHSRSAVPKFWLPDAIVFVDAIPKTGVGKFQA